MTFAESIVNAAPQLLDGDVVFTAGDSLAGGRLIVGGLLAEDRVSILAQGNAAGQIGFDGTTVRYGGVAIGTATGGVGGDFTVTFNGAVTGAAVDALIQRLSYADISDAPTPTRALTLDVVDATGGHLAAMPTPQFTALTGPAGSATANPFAGIGVRYTSVPAFVDLDRDGRLDLVLGEYDGTLPAWRNTGNGFTALDGPAGSATANPFAGIGVGVYSKPAFVDLDGDGRLDLVSGELFGTLLAWRNTGSAFLPLIDADDPFAGIDVGYSSAPTFVDLDGDGRLDLVSGNSGGVLLAWRNTGSGFTALDGPAGSADANPFADIGARGYSTPTFVDLDGDGRLDLVVGNVHGTLLAWRNTGSGFTALDGPAGSATANPFAGIDVGYFSAPAFVDMDGDGRLDLVVGNADGTLLAWRNTTPLPSITVTVLPVNDVPAGPRVQALAPLAEDTPRTLTTADLLRGWTDPDGDPLTVLDLAVISHKPGTLVDHGDGTWTFTPAPNDDSSVVFVYDVSDGQTSRSANVTLDLLPVNDAPVGGVALTATAAQLIAFATLTDADGLGAVTLQWQALQGGFWLDIAGATGPTLVPGAAQAGLSLRAVARYTDGGSTAEEVATDGIAQVGTDAGDWLTGGAAPGVLLGGGGNDRLTGGTGQETLAGGTGKDSIEGDGGDDLLDGGAKADSLVGGAGNDTLVGGSDADVLTGGDGADVFRFLSRKDGVDTITDFTHGVDRIEVLGSAFGGLAAGTVVPFAVGAPVGKGRQFVYDSVTGALGYDVDGSGAKAAVVLATLTGAPALTATDIVVIA